LDSKVLHDGRQDLLESGGLLLRHVTKIGLGSVVGSCTLCLKSISIVKVGSHCGWWINFMKFVVITQGITQAQGVAAAAAPLDPPAAATNYTPQSNLGDMAQQQTAAFQQVLATVTMLMLFKHRVLRPKGCLVLVFIGSQRNFEKSFLCIAGRKPGLACNMIIDIVHPWQRILIGLGHRIKAT
jgi:hypothetical protein